MHYVDLFLFTYNSVRLFLSPWEIPVDINNTHTCICTNRLTARETLLINQKCILRFSLQMLITINSPHIYYQEIKPWLPLSTSIGIKRPCNCISTRSDFISLQSFWHIKYREYRKSCFETACFLSGLSYLLNLIVCYSQNSITVKSRLHAEKVLLNFITTNVKFEKTYSQIKIIFISTPELWRFYIDVTK